jgi:hypothetical protein
MAVTNSVWGRLFGYRLSFDVEWRPMRAEDVPAGAKPHRVERRE